MLSRSATWEDISLLTFRNVNIQTHFYARSPIIRPMQFQTVSDHRKCFFFSFFFSKSFDCALGGDFHLIITIFPALSVNPVRGNLRGEATNNEPSKDPMQPSCPQDNKNFTVFAEPCGMYFTYCISLGSCGSMQGLTSYFFLLIIGCLHNVPNHMGKQMFSPWLYIDFLLGGSGDKDWFCRSKQRCT